jgi:hypothetical protein
MSSLRSSLTGVALGTFLLGIAARPAPAQATKAEVVTVVKSMFEALAKGDTAAMRSYFHADGRIIQTGTREGAPFNRVNPLNAFLQSIGGAVAAGKKLEERIFDPEVKIDDNLGHVWSRYEFLVDGKQSHCGVDSYHLVRTTGGWKIIEIVDTQRACS